MDRDLALVGVTFSHPTILPESNRVILPRASWPTASTR
jgi:hypothetical protein